MSKPEIIIQWGIHYFHLNKDMDIDIVPLVT